MFSFVLSKKNQQNVLTCSGFLQDNVPHKIHPSPIAQPSVIHYLLKTIFTLTTEGVWVRKTRKDTRRDRFPDLDLDPNAIIPHPQLHFYFSALNA